MVNDSAVRDIVYSDQTQEEGLKIGAPIAQVRFDFRHPVQASGPA